MGEFIFISLFILLVALYGVFGTWKSAFDYLKNQRGVTKGIVIVCILVPLIAFVIEEVAAQQQFFTHAYVYTGLDYSDKTLPNCEEGERDNITSNVGFGLNLFESNKTSVNLKYTHHSCAFYHDEKSYDAGGIEVKYTIPLR